MQQIARIKAKKDKWKKDKWEETNVTMGQEGKPADHNVAPANDSYSENIKGIKWENRKYGENPIVVRLKIRLLKIKRYGLKIKGSCQGCTIW